MPPKAKAVMRRRALRRPAAAIPGAGGAPGRRGGLRRPAAQEELVSPWDRGEVAVLRDIPAEKLMGANVVVTEADYFGARVQVAGKVMRVELGDADRHLHLAVGGTNPEEVLKQVTAAPGSLFKVHLCPPGCGLHASGDQYLHGLKGRKRRDAGEVDWIDTLIDVKKPEVEVDEMHQLRRRSEELARERGGVPGGESNRPLEMPGKEPGKEEDSGKKKKKKKRDRRASDFMDGRQPAKAATKELSSLFGGTGLDPKEKVRKRVMARAQQFAAKKRSRRSSSSSGSGTSSSSSPSIIEGVGTDGVFSTDSKARGVAEKYPGALTLETITTMRRSLLTTSGEEADERSTKPVALLYYRNQLARRASGAQARELLNLATALDHLLRGKPALAADVISQRMKSQQAALHGTHWAVAQRMELPLPEEATLVAQAELEQVQKENYAEARALWRAQGSQGGKKGDGKGKQKGGKSERTDWGKDGKREEPRKGKEKGGDKK